MLKAFSDDLAIFGHGLFTKLNLILLTFVNIKNKEN